MLREQVKVVSQRSLDVARAAARTLGPRPRGRGALDVPDDVFHLVADEFVTGRAPDVRARVAYRKELAREYAAFDLPVLFVGNPSPMPLTDARVVRDRRRSRASA